jgi:hypothetical protein
VRTFVPGFLAAFLLAACTQHAEGPLELPLAVVDGFARGNGPAPIETAYNRYKDAVIAVEGVRLGPGLPAGLGSHQYVGLHEPPPPGEEFRVFLTGNVPPRYGGRYRVTGRIRPVGASYAIAVESWQELPSD